MSLYEEVTREEAKALYESEAGVMLHKGDPMGDAALHFQHVKNVPYGFDRLVYDYSRVFNVEEVHFAKLIEEPERRASNS